MRQRIKGSMTVEASFLYPCLIMIAFWLVTVTIDQYAAVNKQASELYDSVFTKTRAETSEILRFADTAFDFFAK